MPVMTWKITRTLPIIISRRYTKTSCQVAWADVVCAACLIMSSTSVSISSTDNPDRSLNNTLRAYIPSIDKRIRQETTHLPRTLFLSEPTRTFRNIFPQQTLQEHGKDHETINILHCSSRISTNYKRIYIPAILKVNQIQKNIQWRQTLISRSSTATDATL